MRLLMGLQPLPLLYDVLIEGDRLRFVLFRQLTVGKVKSEDIERVDEIGTISIGSFAALNFKNRFMARAFMVGFKRAWLARQVLITPEDAERFVQWARKHGIPMAERA
ncbi:hypothetical protein ACI2IY_00465 [Lysobacter enzymogenes]|uniref:hypothetical protein n=1 Tax=Lysobacter enzymogenes TaxID=69 RepID=UPI003850800C